MASNTGERKVSATELVAIAGALGRPVDWFFTESPPAIVSRRRDPAVGGFSRVLDRALEDAARDAAFLESRHLLPSAERPARKAPESFEHAEDLARSVRLEAGRPDGPLPDLQSVAESLGLLGFSLALGPMLVTPHTSRWGTLASRSSTERPIRGGGGSASLTNSAPPPSRRCLRAISQARAV